MTNNIEQCQPGAPCNDVSNLTTKVAQVVTDIAGLTKDWGWIKKLLFSSVAVLVLSAAVGGLFTVLTHFEETKQTTLLQSQESHNELQKQFNEAQKEFNENMLASMDGFSSTLDNLAKLVYRESRRNDLQDYYIELNSAKDNKVREQIGMKKIPTKPTKLPTFEDMEAAK